MGTSCSSQKLAIKTIYAYRFLVKPFWLITAQLIGVKPKCKFKPTCSYYAEEAITSYGTIKGGFLAIRRILSCI